MLLIFLFLCSGSVMGIHAGLRYNGEVLRMLEVLVVNFFVIRILVAVSQGEWNLATSQSTLVWSVFCYLAAFACLRWLTRRQVQKAQNDETVRQNE